MFISNLVSDLYNFLFKSLFLTLLLLQFFLNLPKLLVSTHNLFFQFI